jgi:hypothetical protein
MDFCRNSVSAEAGLKSREGSTSVAFPPPFASSKAFSRSGCGRILPLLSMVMRVGLLTGLTAWGLENLLSGPIFS